MAILDFLSLEEDSAAVYGHVLDPVEVEIGFGRKSPSFAPISLFEFAMWQKIEVLLSKSKILLHSIENNLPKTCGIQVFHFSPSNQDMLLSIAKIDTLILDAPLDSNIPLYKINNVINLTDKQLTSNDIFLQKPIRLAELLNIVHLTRIKDLIFCRLNDHVYDEQMGRLLDQTSTTRLTEKENEIIK